MSKDLNKVLDSKDKNVAGSASSLTRLFRNILFEHGVGSRKWYNLSTRYFKNVGSNVNKTTRQINQDRNNLNRALAKPKIQWSNFVTALRILRPDKIVFRVELHWTKQELVTHHTVEFNNEDMIAEEEEDE